MSSTNADLLEALRNNPTYIKKIVENDPSIVRLQNEDGDLLLHVLAMNNVSADAIKMTYEAYPKAVETQNNNGYLPLHVAIRYKASETVVKMMFEAYPDAANKQDELGYLPIHLALYFQSSVDVVKMIFEAFPKAVEKANDFGWLPLHGVALNNPCFDIVKMIYEAYPKAVEAPSHDKELPLHFAVFKNASIDVIKMLYEAYPKALEMQNNDGYLPLHYACCRDASNEDSEASKLKILDLLLTANPSSLDIKVKNGKLPRDILIEHSSSVHVISKAIVMNLSKHLVKLLLQAYPDSCSEQDNEGKIPLHYACSNNAHYFFEHVILLLDADSDCLKVKDIQGTTPQQMLCQRLSKADENGMFPLHHIASGSGGMSAKVFHLLVNAFPKSIASPDKNGLLPFHRASLNPLSSVEVLFLFIKLLPEVVCVSVDDKSDYTGDFSVLRAAKMPPNSPKDGSDHKYRFLFRLSTSPNKNTDYQKNNKGNDVSRNESPSAKRPRYNSL